MFFSSNSTITAKFEELGPEINELNIIEAYRVSYNTIYVVIRADYPMASDITIDINFFGKAQDHVKDAWGQDQPEIVEFDSIEQKVLKTGQSEWKLYYSVREDEILNFNVDVVYMKPNSDDTYRYIFRENHASGN